MVIQFTIVKLSRVGNITDYVLVGVYKRINLSNIILKGNGAVFKSNPVCVVLKLNNKSADFVYRCIF